MILRVRYFDKAWYDKDLYNYNHSSIHQNRLTHPKDYDFSYYFMIYKYIEVSRYKVVNSTSNKNSLVFLIEANNEVFFVDTILYNKIWPNEFNKDRSIKDSIDSIFNIEKSYNGYIYSFDSCIERVKVMGLESSSEEWLQIDKVLKRDIRINNILNNEI